jgi:hypothetical protein
MCRLPSTGTAKRAIKQTDRLLQDAQAARLSCDDHLGI